MENETSVPAQGGASFAEKMIDDLIDAARTFEKSKPGDAIISRGTRLDQLRTRAIQALIVPDPEYSEEFPTVHDGFFQAALTGVLTHGGSYGHIDGKGDETRLTALARLYADTAMDMRKAP